MYLSENVHCSAPALDSELVHQCTVALDIVGLDVLLSVIELPTFLEWPQLVGIGLSIDSSPPNPFADAMLEDVPLVVLTPKDYNELFAPTLFRSNQWSTIVRVHRMKRLVNCQESLELLSKHVRFQLDDPI